MSRNKSRRRKMKKGQKALFTFLIIILVLVLAVALGGYMYLGGKLSLIDIKEKLLGHQVGVDEQVEEMLKGYRNIALLGVDTRSAGDYSEDSRSDCIIIASINESTGDVKLISVYRDTYVDVEEYGSTKLDKITHAYWYGGAANTLKSLNRAMDMNITEYVTVDMEAVATAVDALGGVDIKIDSEELKYINGYVRETSRVTGKSNEEVTKTGLQTLNGVQAVSYGRIRYTAGADYKRTERMRTVVEAMLKKAKTLSLFELNDFANTILPLISTNISQGDILSLATKLGGFKIGTNLGWPYKTAGKTIDGVWQGIPITLESSVVQLHKDVFGQPNYKVTSTVKDMSDRIIEVTGYTEETAEDASHY